MTGVRVYPDEPAESFQRPPYTFVDDEDREITVRELEPDDFDALVEMYCDFDPSDRAQGIPPTGERRVRDWLTALTEDGLNVLAWHGDEVAGHATLVPDGGGKRRGEDPETDRNEHELAIFVHQSYQRAGIGEELLLTLLGLGQERDLAYVWLSVERWNRAAIGLYEKVGFVTCDAESFELEMSILLEET